MKCAFPHLFLLSVYSTRMAVPMYPYQNCCMPPGEKRSCNESVETAAPYEISNMFPLYVLCKAKMTTWAKISTFPWFFFKFKSKAETLTDCLI